MARTRSALAVALVLAACGGPPPSGRPAVAPTPGASQPPAVLLPPAPETPPPSPPLGTLETPALRAVEPPVAIPPGAVYACVVDAEAEYDKRVMRVRIAN